MASKVKVNRRSHIEVERKFISTALLQAQLDGKYGDYERLRRQQGGGGNAAQQSSALSFFRLPDKEIKDKYLDFEDRLSKKGVWMRRRSTKVIQTYDFPFVNNGKETSVWQAKLRLAGDYISSQMLEAEGVDNMKSITKMYVPDVELNQFVFTAELKTRRKTYIVQKPFGWHGQANQAGEIRLVLDEVTADDVEVASEGEEPFKHVVGEVELTAEVAGGESDREHDLLQRHEMVEMQARLDEFIRRHATVFSKEGVKGKLEAFFEWQKEHGGFGAVI